MKIISFVIPVLNEEGNVDLAYQAIIDIMESRLGKYKFEIIFTDNHSTDKTFEKLTRLAKRDERVRVIRFSKNVGYQRSIYTGYSASLGDAAIQLDCDLQDPPGIIPTFVEKWEEGYKVVYGVRKSRREFFVTSLVRKLFYRLISRISEEPLPHDAGDFRLIDRKLIDVLKETNETRPYIRGAIAAMGFDQIGVPYDRESRKTGSSKFPLRAMIGLAIDGILSQSIVPLRIAVWLGLLVSIITTLIAIGYLVGKSIFGQDWPPGFATTTFLLLISITLNAVFLGIIGEYLGRIFLQLRGRPFVIIESELNKPSAAVLHDSEEVR